MRIGVAQINPVIGDFAGNRQLILEFTEKSKSLGADMVVFPEMSICGYPPMDLLDHGAFVRENEKSLRWLQHHLPKGIAVVIGYVERNKQPVGKSLKNVASILLDGTIESTQEKTLLPTYDVFDEARYFEPAREQALFEWRGEKIGIAICEDLWWEWGPVPGSCYPVDPVESLYDMGATVLVAPSASPFYSGKTRIRRELLERLSGTSNVPMVYVNTVGGNDSLVFDGNSMGVTGDGILRCWAKSFEQDLLVFDTGDKGQIGHMGVREELEKYEEIRQALVTGLQDYLRKTGFSRVHLGLSGGIDSSLVAVIAAQAAGPENVVCFGLPSRYSSEGSRSDSKQLADNLGVRFEVLSIEEPFAAFLDALLPVFKGKEPDVTEENLQARIRGSMLMAYSNKWNSLLLATGNKSELATGYCTLYGDMCGSLAVIGDLFKTEVYALSRHINNERKIIPESILTKAPSAELRPEQTDQDFLPPYDTLDEVLALYLLENKIFEEIVEMGYESDLVHRVVTLVARSEYKRRQAPPVLKVSSRAFGNGRRMPIARKVYES